MRLKVSDTGPGIPDQLRTRIFDRYNRAGHAQSIEIDGTGDLVERCFGFDSRVRLLRLARRGATIEVCGAEVSRAPARWHVEVAGASAPSE